MERVPEIWQEYLGKDILRQIPEREVLGAYQPEDIFRAFSLLEPGDVRVVLLGMDPYPTPGVPEGLSFSVSGERIPPSLRNILKEWRSDLKRREPRSGSLLPWTREGVLLLNAALTVEPGQPGSHLRLWRDFTEGVLLSLEESVFLLFGKDASRLAADLPHKVEVPHPSPLSAWRGFFGSRPFSKVNDLLLSLGREPLSWDLPEKEI